MTRQQQQIGKHGQDLAAAAETRDHIEGLIR